MEVGDTIRPCLDVTGLLACEWRSPGMGYISSPGAWWVPERAKLDNSREQSTQGSNQVTSWAS